MKKKEHQKLFELVKPYIQGIAQQEVVRQIIVELPQLTLIAINRVTDNISKKEAAAIAGVFAGLVAQNSKREIQVPSWDQKVQQLKTAYTIYNTKVSVDEIEQYNQKLVKAPPRAKVESGRRKSQKLENSFLRAEWGRYVLGMVEEAVKVQQSAIFDELEKKLQDKTPEKYQKEKSLFGKEYEEYQKIADGKDKQQKKADLIKGYIGKGFVETAYRSEQEKQENTKNTSRRKSLPEKGASRPPMRKIRGGSLPIIKQSGEGKVVADGDSPEEVKRLIAKLEETGKTHIKENNMQSNELKEQDRQNIKTIIAKLPKERQELLIANIYPQQYYEIYKGKLTDEVLQYQLLSVAEYIRKVALEQKRTDYSVLVDNEVKKAEENKAILEKLNKLPADKRDTLVRRVTVIVTPELQGYDYIRTVKIGSDLSDPLLAKCVDYIREQPEQAKTLIEKEFPDLVVLFDRPNVAKTVTNSGQEQKAVPTSHRRQQPVASGQRLSGSPVISSKPPVAAKPLTATPVKGSVVGDRIKQLEQKAQPVPVRGQTPVRGSGQRVSAPGVKTDTPPVLATPAKAPARSVSPSFADKQAIAAKVIGNTAEKGMPTKKKEPSKWGDPLEQKGKAAEAKVAEERTVANGATPPAPPPPPAAPKFSPIKTVGARPVGMAGVFEQIRARGEDTGTAGLKNASGVQGVSQSNVRHVSPVNTQPQQPVRSNNTSQKTRTDANQQPQTGNAKSGFDPSQVLGKRDGLRKLNARPATPAKAVVEMTELQKMFARRNGAALSSNKGASPAA